MSTNVNDLWNRGGDPLGDIASAIGKFRNDIKVDGPITIGVMRDSPVSFELLKILDNIDNIKVVILDDPNIPYKFSEIVDWDAVNESLAINERIHLVRDKFINNMSEIGILADRQRNLLDSNNKFKKLLIVNKYIDYAFDGRRFAIFDEPVIEKQNNKPWYQDRKHYKNKKSRRKL